jgi:hypothetical protein
MDKIPYDFTRKSLYQAGEADDFFQLVDLSQIESDDVLCADMARLAYVKEEDRLKKYLGRAGFELHETIGYDVKGTQVFIAKTIKSAVKSKLIIVFRGTEGDDIWDILSDAFVFKKTWSDISGKPLGKVHKGFANALLEDPNSGNILTTLATSLNKLADQYASIVITGHSLGAALATLTASYLNTTDLADKIHLYTFGSPLVGNRDFLKQFPPIKHERYVDCCDLVTCIPSDWLNFRHVGTLHYLDRNGQIKANPVNNDEISADRKAALSAFSIDFSRLRQNVWSRRFSDHSPINYLSGVAGLRA